MSHLHIVHDSDAHFTIDPITRAIKNESPKVTVIQHDHNSERFTFSIQKQVEGHDMSACNRVEIHYINIDASDKTKKATGVYEADDLKTSSDDSGKVTFSWLLSRNATQYAGSLNFLIRFACITDGVEEYAWNTAIFQSITVGSGMYNGGEEVIEPYLDVIAQWKNDLFGVGDTQEQRLLTVSAEQQAAIAAKGAAVLDSIPDEYEALQTGVDTLFNSVASGIRGNLSGSVVRADDVSPVEHNPVVKVHGKNLWNIHAIENTSALTVNPDGTIIVAGGKFYCPTDKTLSQICPTLKIGDVVTFTINTTGAPYIYLSGASVGGIGNKKTLTITEDILSATVVLYGAEESAEDYNEPHTINSIQLEIGTTATEYTPYIDPETVTVKRTSKNLIDRELMKSEVTLNGVTITRSGDQITLNGTLTVDSVLFSTAFCLYGGVGNYYALSYEYMGGTVEGSVSVCVGNSETFDSARQSWANIKMQNSNNNYSFPMTKPFIKDLWFYAMAGVKFTNYRIQIQLESGKNATDFETCNGAEFNPAADGTVSGMTSLSPCMTILTDTPGVTVDCEYIVDTKTYIDNKIAEALKGSEQA